MQDFRRLLRYLNPNVSLFLIAIVAMIFAALFEAATGAMIVPIVDQLGIGAKGDSWTLFNLQNLIPEGDWYRKWYTISILLLSFTILKGIFSYLSSYLMAKIGQLTVLGLRRELYGHLLNQSAGFFETHRTNFLVSRIVVSCAAIENAISANLRDVLKSSFRLVTFLSAAFMFNWRLTLGALVLGPIIAVLTSQFSKLIRKFAEVSLDGNKYLSDTAQETLANQTIVSAYNAQPRERQRFAKVAERIANANLRSGKISSISPPTIETLGNIMIVILLFFGLREINEGITTPTQFAAFILFLLSSYDPLRKLSRQHNELSKAFAAAKDVWNVLDESTKLPEKLDAIHLDGLSDGISLKNVSFRYQTDKTQVIKDLSLEIKRGETVALVGESGGGKSSLIKLIQRHYDPEEGAIFWDGHDLRDLELVSLKSQIALVTQETVLFNDTIRYNISYGNPQASLEEIRHAAKIAFADHFIEEFPDSYDSMVGERGSNLSGGQRQRIAIARAVLINAPLIILDEATSALDTESERLVQKALANLMKHHTSIVIAHRLSTIRNADKIVVMEKGRIVETGTHDELIENADVYKKLYELQFADYSSD